MGLKRMKAAGVAWNLVEEGPGGLLTIPFIPADPNHEETERKEWERPSRLVK